MEQPESPIKAPLPEPLPIPEGVPRCTDSGGVRLADSLQPRYTDQNLDFAANPQLP